MGQLLRRTKRRRKDDVRVIIKNAEVMISHHCAFNGAAGLSKSVRGKAKRVGSLRIEAVGIEKVLSTPRAAIPD